MDKTIIIGKGARLREIKNKDGTSEIIIVGVEGMTALARIDLARANKHGFREATEITVY